MLKRISKSRSAGISIRNLEEELDITLFDRIGHRLRLTLAGREFLTHCRKILQETDNSILHMHRLAEKHRKKISLGCVAPVLSRYLPRQMNAFRSLPENRDIEFEIEIEEATTAELIEKLHNGHLPAPFRELLSENQPHYSQRSELQRSFSEIYGISEEPKDMRMSGTA